MIDKEPKEVSVVSRTGYLAGSEHDKEANWAVGGLVCDISREKLDTSVISGPEESHGWAESSSCASSGLWSTGMVCYTVKEVDLS